MTRIPSRLMHRLMPLLSLIVCSASLALAKEEPPLKVCGPYSIAIIPANSKSRMSWLHLVDRSGHVAYAIKGYAVSASECTTLRSNEGRVLIASTYSGGVHCCTTFHVLEMDNPVRVFLNWDAGNQSELTITHLEGKSERAAELVGRDDRLTNFDDLPVAFSPSLPAIFCYKNGAYHECTRQFHKLILSERAGLQATLKFETIEVGRKGIGLQFLALSLMANDEKSGWDWLEEQASDLVPWLRERRNSLADCLIVPLLASENIKLEKCK